MYILLCFQKLVQPNKDVSFVLHEALENVHQDLIDLHPSNINLPIQI